MRNLLSKYKEYGSFKFRTNDILSQQNNAPNHSSGLYLVYKKTVKEENLIYIGISGREGANGQIVHRKDGLGGRLVKGKQFGEARRKSWPAKMQVDNIESIIIKWFVTHGKYNSDFPRPIEEQLLKEFYNKYGRLPEWNNKV